MIDENLQIAGIVASFLSLLVAVFLTLYIHHLNKEQRKRDETFYVAITMKNIQQLKEHLINIQNISENEMHIENKDEQIEISQRLVDYANKNEKLVESLITDIRFSMGKWMNLEDQERKNIDDFVETVRWVLSDYLPKPNENEETQTRKWSTYFEEFQNRKNESSKKIKNLELKYI